MSIDERPARTAVRAPSARRAWAVTVVAAGSAVVVFLDKALLGLVAAPVIADLGLTATGFGAISSASYMLNVVTCLLVGFAATASRRGWRCWSAGSCGRRGRRRPRSLVFAVLVDPERDRHPSLPTP